MPELTKALVEQYTGGRLDKDDAETQSLLDRGLATVRSFCGWHVAPVITDDVQTLDGPGGRLLPLPTLRLVTLTSLVEAGTALDVVADLHVSDRGVVRKRSNGLWTSYYGGIVVTMTHGFDDAEDFYGAVLSWIDRQSLAPTGGRARVVGPFQYVDDPLAPGSGFTALEMSMLARYRLESPA